MTIYKLRRLAKEKMINSIHESRKNGFKTVYLSKELRHLKLSRKEELSANHRAFKDLLSSGVPIVKARKDNGRNFGFQPVIGLKPVNRNNLEDRFELREELDFYAAHADGNIRVHNLLVSAGEAEKVFKPREATRLLR